MAKSAKHTNQPTAEEICRLWDGNEESMGEMAAFSAACEMLGIRADGLRYFRD